MQISPNIYFDIKIANYDTSEPIVTSDNMGRFQLVESAGASLPYLVFSFFTTKSELVGYFCAVNEIEVTIGETAEAADTFKFRLLDNPKNSETSDRGWEIVVGGFLGDTYFMVSKDNESLTGNSLSVINQVMEKAPFEYLKKNIQTNIEKVNEEEISWRRTDETLCSFVMDTVLHMDIRPSFPLVTFDKYGQLHINDCQKLLKEPKWTFVSTAPNGPGELQFINNFNVDSYRPLYDLYSGYSKVTQTQKASTGDIRYVISEDKPIVASTEITETVKAGPRKKTNKIQSDNVHKTYQEVFEYNTNKLIALSAQLGVLVLIGYYPDLKPTDTVYIKLPKSDTGELSALEGYYIIDSIQTSFDFRGDSPRIITTRIFVTRDNPNNVENHRAGKKQKRVEMTKKMIEDLCNAVSQTRVALATCSKVMDGTFIKYCMNFLTETKNNLLRMFSLGGIGIDFNSQTFFIQSMLCVGNNIMNVLTNMLFPDFIASTLRDFLIDKPSSRRLLSKYIDEYVPSELQNIISSLADALCDTQDSLNSIAKANNITARRTQEMALETPLVQEEEPINIVGEIVTEFEQRTQGVDIPFPVITLTESQQLLSREEIKDYMADETILGLANLGYMDGIDKQAFKDILTSDDPNMTLPFVTIKKLNENAGNRFMFRYWGTYGPTNEALFAWSYEDNVVYTKTDTVTEKTRLYEGDYSPYTDDEFKVEKIDGNYKITYNGNVTERNELADVNTTALAQLTSFYITKGFKDKYRTLPCTKLISATKNARLYFACPQAEEDIKFYINSKRVILDSFPIDLGFIDTYGNRVLYNVYYTTTGYNSNSTMLEIRQG